MSRTQRTDQRAAHGSAQPVRRDRAAAIALPSDDSGRPAPRGSRDKSVRIGRTPVGKGVFARRRYPTMAVIGEILGDVIEDANYESRYCMDIGNGRVLEPHAPFRYVNHSCEPNCEFDWFDMPAQDSASQDSAPVERHVFLIALREIKPGEELTIGYNWAADAAIPCRCGAATCRGWIVDPGQLAVVTARNVAPDAAPSQ